MRYLVSGIVSFLLIGLLISCVKENSIEYTSPAKGSLQSTAGDCLPKSVAGLFIANKALNDSNFIEVTIDVTTPGPYLVVTDSINGFYFRGTGHFPSTGMQKLRLQAIGKPVATGAFPVAISFDGRSCSVVVNVLPEGSTGSGAVFTLESTAGNCAAFVPTGSYIKDTVLTNSNTVSVQVNVSVPGAYAVTTNTVNGYKFSASGNFTTTGSQTLVLAGSGKPLAAGTNLFSLTNASGSCSFSITVTATGGSTTSGQYFPLTQANWWTYDDGVDPNDSTKHLVSGTATFSGKTYERVIVTDVTGPLDTLYFRRDAATSTYFQSISTSEFSAFVQMPQSNIEFMFLKDALNTNDTWNTDFSATVSGVPATLRLKFTVINANTNANVNGKAFTKVYQLRSQVQVGMGGIFTDLQSADLFFAQGIGRIKLESPLGNELIRHWQVN